MLAVPDTTGFGGEKIVILDGVGGHVWTWSEHAATPGGPGGRFLIYQGQVRPGGKMGDIIQNEKNRDARRDRSPVSTVGAHRFALRPSGRRARGTDPRPKNRLPFRHSSRAP